MTPFPPLGAFPQPTGTTFRVYAPDAHSVELLLETDPPHARTLALLPSAEGVHEHFAEGIMAGVRYRYRLDGGPPLPDPASRCQPLGVHGPSEVVDPHAYAWQQRD